jgi:hypothetical protein
MEMILGAVADAANKAVGDKLNILGIFHAIFSPTFPVTHPHLALALEFRAAPFEKGQNFVIEIVLRDPDGKQTFGIQGNLQLSKETPALSPIIPFDINIHNVHFPAPGNYRFEILINGSHKGELPLELVQISAEDEAR